MAAPARVQLGAAMLNKQWWFDVNTGTYAVPVWTPVNGHTDFKPLFETEMQDDSDADTLTGAGSEIATASTWSIETTLVRKVKADDATSYDPGQEYIRAAGLEIGYDNVVDVRFYEMNVDSSGTVTGPTTEAYRGYAAVSWSPDGGDRKALSSVTLKLSGRGDRTAITHPEAAAQVPTVLSITPSTGAAAGGEAAYIKGQFFTGATDVEFGTTNADDYVVIDDNTIAVVTPALVAGPYTIEVTNAAGASVSGPVFTYS